MPIYHPSASCRYCIYHNHDMGACSPGSCTHPEITPSNEPSPGGVIGPGAVECAHFRMKANCEGCKFYMPRPGGHGVCRRRAPVSGVSLPFVGNDFWCGEWEAKP